MADVDEKRRAELAAKLKALAEKKYGPSSDASWWPHLFEDYDGDKDGSISKAELLTLFVDADVGGALTRAVWVARVIAALDADASQGVSFAELNKAIAPTTPPPVKSKPLTRAEAAAIARVLATSTNKVDLSAFSQLDQQLIEEENLALTVLPVTDKPASVPPKKQPPPSSGGFGEQLAIGIVVTLLTLGLAKGWRR